MLGADGLGAGFHTGKVNNFSHGKQRMAEFSMLLGRFSLLALVLAGMGVYRGISYSVPHRQQEIRVQI